MPANKSAYFDIPLNLPHACRIAQRIRRIMESRGAGNPAYHELKQTVETLEALLLAFEGADDAKETAPETVAITENAARLGRTLAHQIADLHLDDDRMGQCVRNLFECLYKGREGADLGLVAGENPASLQRP